MIAGTGVTVTPTGLRAVAIDTDGRVVAQHAVGGVTDTAALTIALRRLVGAVGGGAAPVAVAWDDERRGRAAVELDRDRPADVATHLRGWAAVGIGRITVVDDEHGGRWAVTADPGGGVGDRIRRAAARAGLVVIAVEPVTIARTCRDAPDVAATMAAVASGGLAPSVELTVRPPSATAPGERVWVIERRPDDGATIDAPRPRPRAARLAAVLGRITRFGPRG